MSHDLHSIDHIAELLVHVGRAARAGGARGDLTVGQWACLRFLARANASTRTPSAFASFQATTRGTASQIIKVLEARGLISKHQSDHDQRSVRFDLTSAGRAMLLDDPLRNLTALLGGLEPDAREVFRATLSQLSSALAKHKQARAFGTCVDCTHFSSSEGDRYCVCIAAEVNAGDIDKLCGSYSAPSTVRKNR